MTIFHPSHPKRRVLTGLTLGVGLGALAACSSVPLDDLDWDLRGSDGNTSAEARQATAQKPVPDANGILSYPGYQLAQARRGETVASMAGRLGLGPEDLARTNALRATDPLREGELLLLPKRVAAAPQPVATAPSGSRPVDITSIATTALDQAGAPAPAPAPAKAPAASAPGGGKEPLRHKVARGETAFTIARAYNVSPKDLADWNGLDANLSVREGQYLLIPVVAAAAAPAAPVAVPMAEPVTLPGSGSPTPVPPSAAKPLPAQDEPPIAAAPAPATTSPTAKAPAPAAAPAPSKPVADLGATRSESGGKLAMPVGGQIIRGYSKGKNDGIDIGAAAGTSVAAAGDGTVAAITKNTEGVPILVIRHADNLLTVYGGIDAVSVAKGATVKRGQSIAKVRSGNPSFLHFEVRKGFDSVDPTKYLQ